MKNISCKRAAQYGKIAVEISLTVNIVERYKYLRLGGVTMKQGIHPKYEQTTITCVCGNVIETGSVKKDLKVEICSACHPFFTGSKSRITERGGRVDRFKQRYGMK